MEYTLKKELCSVCETVLESSSEQPVDLDFSLPDYCPDIERILKCRMCPSISSKSITGDRLDVEGIVVIRLYYLDSKRQAVRLCEHTSPFSCSFELKKPQPDMTASVRLKNEYLNCRAVSPRRLDIHGAFSVIAAVRSRTQREYSGMIEGDDIQQQCHNEALSELRGMAGQQFSISEVLDIGKGKSSPETILRSELTIKPGDCRAIDDKLMLKGEAVLRLLYVTDIEIGAQDSMSFEIPFSQVLDVRGIDGETKNDISVDILGFDVSLRSEYDEDSTLVTLDARLCANVFAWSDKELTLVDDAYSTAFELETEKSSVPVTRIACLIDDTIQAKDEINTGDNQITKVIDLWCDSISSMVSCDSGKASVKGKMNCCMLALDKGSVPFCAEKTIDISFEPDCPEMTGKLTFSPELTAGSLNFIITGDHTVDIKADIRIRGAVYETRSCRCITAASASEDRCREKDRQAALTIYYAQNESLWDIARMYCTSVEALRLENDMPEGEEQADGMVLIPM